MAEEEANLTDEERAELENPVIEDEDTDVTPDEDLDSPTDMPDGVVEDDSGFLEEVVEDGDPVLEMEEGTQVGVGSS